ncbi:MAG: transposase zinc-binding domain-containing protein, partial [Anaerolineae bacterium]|nr:transposase zinc-binding domain-containing protein [Anaerolineae bacterium]
CGAWARAQWPAAQEQLLLLILYFHIVFTTEHAINALVAGGNERVIYDLLFRAATERLKAYRQRELGGALGITAEVVSGAAAWWGSPIICA